MESIAIIPARGGSKRIPGKNIKEFCGQPMIAWVIQALQQSQQFQRIVVSTDDPRIAEVAKAYGADVPFLRPEPLSDDFTGTTPVIQHAIRTLELVDTHILEEIQQAKQELQRAKQESLATDLATKEKSSLNHEFQQYLNTIQAPSVACVYATAPFLQAEDFEQALDLLQEQQPSFVFSVCTFPAPIQRALALDDNHRIYMEQAHHAGTRSQDLPERFHDAGQFYLGHAHTWLMNPGMFTTGAMPYVLPRHRVQDIDTQEDWIRAEYMMKAMQMMAAEQALLSTKKETRQATQQEIQQV